MRRALRVGVAIAIAAAVIWTLAPASVETAEPVEKAEPVAPARPEPIRVAVVRPPAHEPAATRPAPEPPAPKPEATAAVQPGERALRRGTALLDAGAFPHLRATYERIGFDAYRDAMLRLGGRFYLFDPRERRPLARVDPGTNALEPPSVPDSLSRWPRDVTRHLPGALERGRTRYGTRAGRVILLPPRALDAALLGALDARLRELGLRASDARGVRVAYELHDGRLHASVLGITLRDGSERALPLVVDLSRAEIES
jgi:hypothetical protein